jgi:predicted  nucleic acid-binding Zn-ribbon protein
MSKVLLSLFSLKKNSHHNLVSSAAHLEEFKKELKGEVRGMTQEVGRLHRERQSVENQIADLLMFYSKQKNAAVCTNSAFPTLWLKIL